MTHRIIAFTGSAGAGKTTAAQHLVAAHGFTRVRFAGPLKAMLAALGLTAAEIDGDRKEIPCDLLCGRTPRWAMQSLGTEWGRELIGSDLWTRAWRAALPPGDVVVDDCRFPNEVDAIWAEDGTIVRVERPGAAKFETLHVSEAHALPYRYALANIGSIDAFRLSVTQLFETILASAP